MKPERSFIAERPLAQHCAQLMAQDTAGLAPVDALPSLARVGDRLVRTLPAALAPLLGGVAPTIATAAPAEADLAALIKQTPKLCANSLFVSGIPGMPLLAMVDAAAVLRVVDRTFGGKGQAPSPLPEAFPLSAEILVRRIEGIVGAALAEALGAGIEAVRRGGDLSALEPFAETTPLAIQTLTVTEGVHAPWQIVIALPLTTLGALFGDAKQTAARANVPARGANPTDEPFGDLPLTLSAVIVDMRLTMSALSGLRPGAMIPVSVARNVPLRIGEKTIAHGSIGAVDDRVAIQISQAF